VLTGEELRAIVDRKWPLLPVAGIDPSSTSVVYRFADGAGEMGFINPVSQPFCATCDRIRLTADLKTPLRAGASDGDLEQVVRAAVHEKEKKHKINEGEAFQRASRSMSQIGG
jgi:cyclic pyranopterin phosphate synthase